MSRNCSSTYLLFLLEKLEGLCQRKQPSPDFSLHNLFHSSSSQFVQLFLRVRWWVMFHHSFLVPYLKIHIKTETDTPKNINTDGNHVSDCVDAHAGFPSCEATASTTTPPDQKTTKLHAKIKLPKLRQPCRCPVFLPFYTPTIKPTIIPPPPPKKVLRRLTVLPLWIWAVFLPAFATQQFPRAVIARHKSLKTERNPAYCWIISHQSSLWHRGCTFWQPEEEPGGNSETCDLILVNNTS